MVSGDADGCGVEVDVFDVLDAGEAEAPVVDDFADGVADACVVGVLVENGRGHDEHSFVVQQRDPPVHVAVPAGRRQPEREIQGPDPVDPAFQDRREAEKWIGAMKASASAAATLA